MNSTSLTKGAGFEIKREKTFLMIGLLMTFSELVKQQLLVSSNGGQYQWWYFPWQLCSIPMYVCVIAGLCKNSKIYDASLAFLSDFGLLAGICAFLDTTGFAYELMILTIHSYIWHIMLIGIGIYAWYIRSKNSTYQRAFPGGLCIYAIGCTIAELINIIAYDNGARPINMFYISPRYIMGQIYIRNMVPVLGNSACILIYIAVTILGALIIEIIGNLCIKNVGINKKHEHTDIRYKKVQ